MPLSSLTPSIITTLLQLHHTSHQCNDTEDDSVSSRYLHRKRVQDADDALVMELLQRRRDKKRRCSRTNKSMSRVKTVRYQQLTGKQYVVKEDK